MSNPFVIVNSLANAPIITTGSRQVGVIDPQYTHSSYCTTISHKSEPCDSPTNFLPFSCPSVILASQQSTNCLCDPSYSHSFIQNSFSFPNPVVVYDASPVDDPNAYQGAIVLRFGNITPDKPGKDQKNTEYCFGCSFSGCDFVCESANEMREHFKDHPGKHQYRCLHPGCKFASSVLKDMNYHRGYHTGERPFRCNYPNCGFAAPNQSQLRLHMVSHSEEKPYKCSFSNCLYVTRYKSALINHERTHTGEKPYKCKYCKSFSAKQKSGLQYHIKTVHMS